MVYREEQYQKADNLNTRIMLHERYSINPQGFHQWVFSQFGLKSGIKVLECGCGPGALWSKNKDKIPDGLDVILVDLSAGMLEFAEEAIGDVPTCKFTYSVGDIQSLNYKDNTFDIVIANHMMYHVPDIMQGLNEVKRVLKIDGEFFSSTFSKVHLKELNELTAEYIQLPDVRTSDRFCLENGYEMVNEVFGQVELRKHEDALHVTDANDLIAYILSGSRAKVQLTGQKKIKFIEDICQRFEQEHRMVIHKDAGVLISRKH